MCSCIANFSWQQVKSLKGKLKASEGNGLRKLLYPFVTSNTMMSIVFTLSPSKDNIKPTRATMKFAMDACKLKMKPLKGKAKVNKYTFFSSSLSFSFFKIDQSNWCMIRDFYSKKN